MNGSLGLILIARGFTIRQADGIVEVQGTREKLESLPSELETIARGGSKLEGDLKTGLEPPNSEKFHPFLGGAPLMKDALSRKIDLGAAQAVAARLIAESK